MGTDGVSNCAETSLGKGSTCPAEDPPGDSGGLGRALAAPGSRGGVRGTFPAVVTSLWPQEQGEEGKEVISPHGQVRAGSGPAQGWGREGWMAGVG